MSSPFRTKYFLSAKGKTSFRFNLVARSWTTASLVILSASALIGYAIWLILEAQQICKGVAKVYVRNGQVRLQITYEHVPRNGYDISSPDQSLTPGTEVTVWAYGTELWNVRTIGPSPRFTTGSPDLYTPISMFVVALLLFLWYFLGVKK